MAAVKADQTHVGHTGPCMFVSHTLRAVFVRREDLDSVRVEVDEAEDLHFFPVVLGGRHGEEVEECAGKKVGISFCLISLSLLSTVKSGIGLRTVIIAPLLEICSQSV